MATVTPNFNWPVPTSTDLVKDGATAIEALGDSIDASLVDLKGGTTGQVLSKTSGTDMDFTWVTTDDANAIQNSIVDAKGDLISATGNDTPARLAVGNNGETLVADSSTSTGLRYTSNFAAGKNKIINGDFNINQRNFTSVTTSTFGFDRWLIAAVGDGSTTYTPETFTLGTAPVTGYEAKNFAQLVTTGQTSAPVASYLGQRLESVRTFAGQTVTISFWAKAASGTPKVAVEAQQYFGAGGSPSATVNTYAGQVTLSTSWARYSVNIAVPSISGKTLGTDDSNFLAIHLWVSGGTDRDSRTGSLGIQTGTFQFWGVQAEAGSVATAFQTATGTIQGELAACQRYYYLHASGSSKSICSACYTTASQIVGSVKFPVTMRTSPTLVATSGTNYYRFSKTGTDDDFNSLTIINSGENAAEIYNNSEVSGTAGYGGPINTLNASASVAFSAEL
jgi:hypothetical protein